ncbi:hypothetical protein RJZ57_002858 [Blastomyces gilchristii]
MSNPSGMTQYQGSSRRLKVGRLGWRFEPALVQIKIDSLMVRWIRVGKEIGSTRSDWVSFNPKSSSPGNLDDPASHSRPSNDQPCFQSSIFGRPVHAECIQRSLPPAGLTGWRCL